METGYSETREDALSSSLRFFGETGRGPCLDDSGRRPGTLGLFIHLFNVLPVPTDRRGN